MFSAYLWPGRLMLAAPALHNDPHRHVGASVLIGVNAPFQIGIAGQLIQTRLALLSPEVEHRLQADTAIVVLRIDPDQALYRAHLQPALAGQAYQLVSTVMPHEIQGRLQTLSAHPPSCCDAAALLAMVLATLRGSRAEGAPLDARIAAVVRHLRETLPERIKADALAASSGLSSSRLTHLFKQEVGVSMRRFLLAIRLQDALIRWRASRTLTHLAHETGFADLAHLSQAGRAYTGIPPSTLVSLFGGGLAERVFVCSDTVC